MGADLRRMVEEHSRAEWPDRLLLVYLSERADGGGYVQVGQRDLCQLCGTEHRSTISAAIKRLEETGELEVVRVTALGEQGKLGGGRRAANIYRIRVDLFRERSSAKRTSQIDGFHDVKTDLNRSRTTTCSGRKSRHARPEQVANRDLNRLGSATVPSPSENGRPVASADGGQAAASASGNGNGAAPDTHAGMVYTRWGWQRIVQIHPETGEGICDLDIGEGYPDFIAGRRQPYPPKGGKA